ncbi:non-ribosomal peptide synthetase [Rhodococcus sp. 14-2483-1-2]|uniref:non-ribosomal peptide synthetase n=1 Tax=Rhodococcus sp. 14-2483-1-2 TaxID=2023147 RepID=UPI000B9AEE39|nr:non-ribosomal peptide synthetase [Rhodococcus sp. 14-2483-1-2]OZF26274.1 hypothetical protein CH295_27160 [Rhodococcus sp. 14-2483-1-2]
MTIDHRRQRMWLLHKLAPQDIALNLGLALELTGALDITSLDNAVRLVAGTHPVLRTVYTEDLDGNPVARIEEHGVGLVSVGRIESQDRLEIVVRREFAHVFDLEREHSIRVSIVECEPSKHVLVVVAHHIAWDDGCWAPYLSSLTDAYQGHGLVSPIEFVCETGSSASVEYWNEKLGNVPESIEFPGENGLTRSARSDSAIVRSTMSASSTAALVAASETTHSSVFEILLAIFEIVVSRYCRAREFTIAVPIDNRDDSLSVGRIGYVGNTLVLRATIDPHRSIGEVLHAVSHDHRQARRHADVELDDIVRRVNPDRAGGTNSAVRLCFSERSTLTALFEPAGVHARVLTSDVGCTQVPLSLEFEMGEECVLRLEYQTDVLAEAVVLNILGSVRRVLDAFLLGGTRTPVADVPLWTEPERDAILARSRGIARPVEPKTLVELCAEQLISTPNADAVVDDAISLSYRELDRRSTTMAHWLISEGVEPGSTVATLFSHSVELVVAALGILKAGAVYLPLDRTLPLDRLQYILDDAGATAVLGDTAGLDVGDARPLGASGSHVGKTDLPSVHPGAPAYMVYTSASTGPPKGVVVSHAAIVEYLEWIIDNGRLGIGDSVLQVASPGFDVSIGEIFGCLGSGARLVVPRQGGLSDVGYLTDVLRARDISSMHFVPSLLATFLTLPGVDRWTSLRRVPVGGEPLPGPLADQFNAMFDARLYNFYGPTETTLAATQYEVTSVQGACVVPIGTPKDNTQVYVLDERMRPVGLGVIGELYVGGTQLALGYHGRQALTSERFVADPFSTGGRLYRTGDLGRWSRDSGLEFIGRVDQQVKIRGFRIERSEVEAVIALIADVDQVFVDVVDHPVRGTVLVAYVVTDQDSALEHRVRTEAAALLPGYMIPERVVTVDRIPVTTNGKLDRASLPCPEFETVASGRAPRTDTEAALAAMFASLVGVDSVDVDDSFFDVGGHSLSAVRLTARIRAEFCVDIPVREVFSSPTVTALAEMIDLAVVRLRRPPSALRPPIVPVDDDLRSPLSISQIEIWLAHLDTVDDTDNLVFGAEITGPVDIDALEKALADLVRRHRILATSFPSDDGVPVRRYLDESPTVARSRSNVPSEQLLWRAAQCRIEITTGLPIRAELVVRSPAESLLILVVHHIACDSWSAPILFADLATAYRARCAGSPPMWSPLVHQYPDFAAWQARLPSLAEQAEYWRTELPSEPQYVPGPPASVRAVDLAPDPLLMEQFDSLAAQVDDAVAAAILVTTALVAALSGADDIVVRTPIPGHVPTAADGMVGPLVNKIAVRTRMTGSEDVATVLTHIAERISAGLDHNDVSPGFEASHGPTAVLGRTSGPRVRFGLSGVLSTLPSVHPAGTTDLTVTFDHDPAGLACRIEFSESRYTSEQLTSLLPRIVADLAEHPYRQIGGALSRAVPKASTR